MPLKTFNFQTSQPPSLFEGVRPLGGGTNTTEDLADSRKMESRFAAGANLQTHRQENQNMRRPYSTTGTKFTVRGQAYVQTGAFFHPMSNDREVRVLELRSTCPECPEAFQVTASMRQIQTRQLIRRCPSCRKIHFGPVKLPPPVKRKPARKATIGRKPRKVRNCRAAAPGRTPPQATERHPGCAIVIDGASGTRSQRCGLYGLR
jgi:hypothetical protein